ncbi:MAG TPA: site-2 protease family protein [Thermodesulfobacteriota bacterium]|nr:site-2 protease family protein [Thermodesulfobacteriota bacterium]
MPRGIRLFRVLGIQISIDYTWFIVFILFAWSLSFGYFPHYYPGLDRTLYMVMGTVSALLLFACVLVHELSHSYTANRLGLDISEITLFIFGGVAQLTKEPEDAATELKIAVAGPIASGVLAVIFYLASRVVTAEVHAVANAILAYLSLINAMLLVFNMIPGFPLDGGRVLRAAWWAKTGDLNAATKAASQIGKGFALFLILMGFLQVLTGNFIGGMWMVLIGVFLQQAAASGYQQLVIKRVLEGVRVRDVMSRKVVSVNEDMTVSEAVDAYFFRYHFVSFPVESMGRVVGILSLNQVRSVDKERWADTPVKDVMVGLEPGELLGPNDNALETLAKITTSKTGRLPVVDRGELVGIVSRGDIIKLIEFKMLLRK